MVVSLVLSHSMDIVAPIFIENYLKWAGSLHRSNPALLPDYNVD